MISFIPIDQICNIKRGSSITKKLIKPGNVPVIASGQTPAYFHNISNFNGNIITVSTSGAYAGFVNYFDYPIFASGCFTIASKNERKFLTKYIFYYLKWKQQDIYAFQSGSAQPNISLKDLKQFSIPLIPIKEQIKIIKILDEIINIQRIQKESYDLYMKIIRSLFYKHFGDPLINDKKLPKSSLKSHSESIKSGFACGKFSKKENKNILHLRPMNITPQGKLSFNGSKYICPSLLSDINSYSIQKGDVLFNNTNSKELVGKSCYIQENLINTAFSNHITRIRTKNTLNPLFLSIQLQVLQEKGYFSSLSNKWIGQAGINHEKLANLLILVPEITLQKNFAEKVHQLFCLIENKENSLKRLDELLASAMHHFFFFKQ